MALKKTFVKENGISTSYHKITYAGIRFEDDVLYLEAKLTSFMNEHYRNVNESIEDEYYRFVITAEEETNAGGIRKLSYGKIKTLEEWADAEDC